jgi:hypothetical protein
MAREVVLDANVIVAQLDRADVFSDRAHALGLGFEARAPRSSCSMCLSERPSRWFAAALARGMVSRPI